MIQVLEVCLAAEHPNSLMPSDKKGATSLSGQAGGLSPLPDMSATRLMPQFPLGCPDLAVQQLF